MSSPEMLQVLAAKDEVIRAKDAQIEALKGQLEALRELAPLKIREYFVTAQRELKDYVTRLEGAFDQARHEIAHCEAEIARGVGGRDADTARALASRRDELTAVTTAMKADLKELQHQCEYPDNFVIKLPSVNIPGVEHLAEAYAHLAGLLALDGTAAVTELSAALHEHFKYRLDENTLFSNVVFTRPATRTNWAEIWQRPDNGE